MKMTRKLAAAIAAATLIGGAAMADPAAISQSITDIAAGADRHDWTRVRDAFADTVTTDYSSLWGGDPVTQPADDLVGGWAAFLPGFDVTHHMVTNHTIVAMDETTASAEADFTATHRIDDGLWVLGGRYSYELVKGETRWEVTSMTMTALWETGDRALVGVAGERAAAAN
jgi:ABC-type glycerol-3-phosphate transport system substrate-binding protein